MHGRHRTPPQPTHRRSPHPLVAPAAALRRAADGHPRHQRGERRAARPGARTSTSPRRDIGWTITSYSLIFGSLLLLGGRAADLLGRRRVFLTGLGVFTASSLATALAGDADDAVRRPRRPGPRRRDALPGRAVDHHDHLPRPRARQGARRLGRGRRRRRRDRRAARRRADRARRLARDLLHQPARRRSRSPPARCTLLPADAGAAAAGAASTCAARCWPPPASARSSTPLSQAADAAAGPRRRRSASAPPALAGLAAFAALELRTAQPLLRVQRLADRARRRRLR